MSGSCSDADLGFEEDWGLWFCGSREKHGGRQVHGFHPRLIPWGPLRTISRRSTEEIHCIWLHSQLLNLGRNHLTSTLSYSS